MLSVNKKYWFVFYCKSRTEKKVNAFLTENNYTSYLPLFREVRQWSDRKKKIDIPMFRGYIFIKCYLHEVHSIVKIPNIVASVKVGNEHAVLREKEIELLKKIEDNGLNAVSEPISVQKGERVVVKRGALKDYEGICVQQMGKNYILIAIDAIEQYIKVKVHLAEIEKQKPKKA